MNKYKTSLYFIDSVVDDSKIIDENKHNYDLAYNYLYDLSIKQEPKALIKKAKEKFRCPTCGAIHNFDTFPNYCYNCGQKLKP